MSFNIQIEAADSTTAQSAFPPPFSSNAPRPSQAAVSNAADVVFSNASSLVSSNSNPNPTSMPATSRAPRAQSDIPMNHGSSASQSHSSAFSTAYEPFGSSMTVESSIPLWYDPDRMQSLASVYLIDEAHHPTALFLILRGYEFTQETLPDGTSRPTKKTIPFILLLAEYCLKKGLIMDAKLNVMRVLQLDPDHTEALKLLQELESIAASSSTDSISYAPQAKVLKTGFEGCVIQ